MIEYQRLNSSTSDWYEVPDFQLIRLKNIKFFRFRFHGKVVSTRNYLNAYLEKEIIYARLSGGKVDPDWLRTYKCS